MFVTICLLFFLWTFEQETSSVFFRNGKNVHSPPKCKKVLFFRLRNKSVGYCWVVNTTGPLFLHFQQPHVPPFRFRTLPLLLRPPSAAAVWADWGREVVFKEVKEGRKVVNLKEVLKVFTGFALPVPFSSTKLRASFSVSDFFYFCFFYTSCRWKLRKCTPGGRLQGCILPLPPAVEWSLFYAPSHPQHKWPTSRDRRLGWLELGLKPDPTPPLGLVCLYGMASHSTRQPFGLPWQGRGATETPQHHLSPAAPNPRPGADLHGAGVPRLAAAVRELVCGPAGQAPVN